MFFVKAQNHFTLFILFQQHGQVSAKMHMQLLREMHLSMGLVISKYYIIEFISLQSTFFPLFSHSPLFEKSLLYYMGKRGICGIYHHTLANEHRRTRKGRTIDMASAPKPFSVDGGKEGGRKCAFISKDPSSALLVLSSKSLVDRLRSWMVCVCECKIPLAYTKTNNALLTPSDPRQWQIRK